MQILFSKPVCFRTVVSPCVYEALGCRWDMEMIEGPTVSEALAGILCRTVSIEPTIPFSTGHFLHQSQLALIMYVTCNECEASERTLQRRQIFQKRPQAETQKSLPAEELQ